MFAGAACSLRILENDSLRLLWLYWRTANAPCECARERWRAWCCWSALGDLGYVVW